MCPLLLYEMEVKPLTDSSSEEITGLDAPESYWINRKHLLTEAHPTSYLRDITLTMSNISPPVSIIYLTNWC